jgi:transposase
MAMGINRTINSSSETRRSKPRGEIWSVLNAIFYLLTQGCTWRNLPGDFPAWQTVYTYFAWRVTRHARNWRKDGTWIAIHEKLRDWVRSGALRSGSPTMKVRQDRNVGWANAHGQTSAEQ